MDDQKVAGFNSLNASRERKNMTARNLGSVLLLFCISAFAQHKTDTIPLTGYAGLDQYRASRIAIFTDDYGQLQRYRADDATVKAMPENKNRVVFFGDSITDGWKLDNYF